MDVNIDIMQSGSSLVNKLLANSFDHNILRPYRVGEQCFINNAAGGDPIKVNDATLRKDEWILLDTAVTKVARERLNFVTDLRNMGLTTDIKNAMGITKIEYQNQSDIGDASVSMDGINKGENDRPVFDLTSIPIPIVSKDFTISARELAASRNSGQPIDSSNAEQGSRKVSETVEKLHLGTYGTYKFAGSNLYGICNFPDRITTTFTDWAASSKTNEQRFADILGFVYSLRAANRYGPIGIYVSGNYVRYLDEDYKANSDITLRERILKVGVDNPSTPGKIRFVKALDYLANDTVMVIQLTSDVIQSMNGMNTTVLQWTEQAGMQVNMKIMSIVVPRVRSDYNGSCGILHAVKA